MVITQDGSANGAVAVTIPGDPTGLHAIRRILLYRTATVGVVGSAELVITTSNLPKAIRWTTGNAIAVGGRLIDVDEKYSDGSLISTATGVDTVINLPAPGIGTSWHAIVYYDLVTA